VFSKSRKLKYTSEDGYELKYAHHGDAGIDLAIKEEVILDLTKKVGTGISVEIPEGFFGMLVPRSSMGKKGIALGNTVGIIDHQYRGEIQLMLRNLNRSPITIAKGERVAQLIVVPFMTMEPTLVEELDESKRGTDGWGSTGTR
jgi:dUTP pyrophosphatase